MSQQYSTAFKSRMLRRLIGPDAVSANALAQDVGVSQAALSRWLRESRTVEPMTSSKKKQWTGAEKLRVLLEARGLSETDLGALLRREGLHETDLTAWQAAAEAALSPSRRAATSAEQQRDQRRIHELERELRRKDAALAETAALLVLKKKVQEIWGDEDDTTAPRPER
jgi:transcriptional regulator with XRE-family HTH domain